MFDGAAYIAGTLLGQNGLGVFRIDDVGAPRPACVGDCDGGGTVTVDELITGHRRERCSARLRVREVAYSPRMRS